MIVIKKSTTADTRTCDWSKVTREQLLQSSIQHRNDVKRGFEFFCARLIDAAKRHDIDKIGDIDSFHADFQTGFNNTTWWDNHRKIARHHLLAEDGIPQDVNLVDVLDMITDCVMAGMGRAGSVYPLEISPELLKRAFDNTVEMLKAEITVGE